MFYATSSIRSDATVAGIRIKVDRSLFTKLKLPVINHDLQLTDNVSVSLSTRRESELKSAQGLTCRERDLKCEKNIYIHVLYHILYISDMITAVTLCYQSFCTVAAYAPVLDSSY